MMETIRMPLEEKRYEFYWKVVMKKGGIVIDVAPRGINGLTKQPCLVFMSEDKGETEETSGHTIYGYIEFHNKNWLGQAQVGLNLLQEAIDENYEAEER